MIKKIVSVSIALCSILFLGCNNSTKEEKNLNEEIVDTTKTSTEIPTEEAEELSYNLPSALQIAYVSKKSGAKYNASLLNNTNNVTKYNTSNYKRAINFGVYSSDLANCLFNKKYQESKEYLKVLKEMGSYLGLNQAFESENLAERFDKNINNEDTLVKIVSNVQLKTDLLFDQNKQKHITLIAFAGAWIESLNIAGESYLKEKNKKVLASFCEQLLFSPTLLKALEANKLKEAEIPELLNEINSINTSFNSISSVKSALEKDEEMNFSAMNFTDVEIKTIADLVKELRTKMVN
jgi:tyrosyl-tRNA synthetase